MGNALFSRNSKNIFIDSSFQNNFCSLKLNRLYRFVTKLGDSIFVDKMTWASKITGIEITPDTSGLWPLHYPE